MLKIISDFFKTNNAFHRKAAVIQLCIQPLNYFIKQTVYKRKNHH